MTKRSRASKAAGVPDADDVDMALRALARRYGAAAITALAQLVTDAETPAGARLTAATTLLGWAFGRESGEMPGRGQSARKTPITEQVIRLAWMEPKARTRGKGKRSRTSVGTGTGPKPAR